MRRASSAQRHCEQKRTLGQTRGAFFMPFMGNNIAHSGRIWYNMSYHNKFGGATYGNAPIRKTLPCLVDRGRHTGPADGGVYRAGAAGAAGQRSSGGRAHRGRDLSGRLQLHRRAVHDHLGLSGDAGRRAQAGLLSGGGHGGIRLSGAAERRGIRTVCGHCGLYLC